MEGLGYCLVSAAASTQISAHLTHKNLALRKIMEVMRTAYANKRDSASTASQTEHDANDHGTYTSMWRTFYFAESLVVKVLLKCAFVSLFLFVGTHFQIFVGKFPALAHTQWTQNWCKWHTMPFERMFFRRGRCLSVKSLSDLMPPWRHIATRYKFSICRWSHFMSGSRMKPVWGSLSSNTILSCSACPSRML